MTTIDIPTPTNIGSRQLAMYRKWAKEPNKTPPEYSVVIPAYNEAERIVPTIGAIATHLSSLGEPWELIVADDGSTDTTVATVRGLGLANLRVLEAPQNAGKGAAVRRGVMAAKAPVILFADADQSTPIEQFGRLLREIKWGADVVIGSRSAVGADVENKSKIRNVLSRGLNVLVQTGLGIPIEDTQCGFKLFRREAARELFAQQYVERFAFDLEVLYLAGKRDLQVVELPVRWIDAPGSTVDPLRVSLEFLATIGRIRWNALRGRYSGKALESETAAPQTTTRRSYGYSDA